jgi:PKD repeat protein
MSKDSIMRTLLLTGLLLSVKVLAAQVSFTDGDCKAFFKYEVNDKMMFPYAATAINFYDLSAGKIKGWYWDFGDGTTSNEQNPLHIFMHPVSSPDVKMSPYRTIGLTILTDTCKSFYSIIINIIDGTQYVEPVCKAGFKYYLVSRDSVSGVTKIGFSNLSRGDSLTCRWQFGDGSTSHETNPIMVFENNPGIKYVCLTVAGKNGCTDTFCDTVRFSNPAEPPSCEVSFRYEVNTRIQTFAAALVLDFYSKASEEVKEWHWDFGDGTSSSDPNPTHIFNYPPYKDSIGARQAFYRVVTLSVLTTTGCAAKKSETINIYMNTTPPPEPSVCHAWFKYYTATDVVTIPEVVPYWFADVSQGKVMRRLWRFENGDSSTVEKPLVTFSIFKPTQKVCLTVYTADSCVNTWCETIYVSTIGKDTAITVPDCPYAMKIKSGFPIQMSSCAGWAHAQVYLKDSLISSAKYAWSTGTEGQDVKNLCPTSAYSVKAIVADGCLVTSSFIFNSDGTVIEVPVTWWVSGTAGNQNIQYNLNGRNLNAEWILPDGTIVKSDSILLNSVNGVSDLVDLIVRDSTGNVVYTEKISLKSLITRSVSPENPGDVRIYPNPAREMVYLDIPGKSIGELEVTLYDVSGRIVLNRIFHVVPSDSKIGLEVSNLGTGMYACKIVLDNKEVIVRKFIK